MMESARSERYFINNFYDGEKQDAIDILLGNFRPKFENPSPFTMEPPFIFMSIFLMWLTLATALALFLPLRKDAVLMVQALDAIKYATVATLVIILLQFFFTFKKGTELGKLLATKASSSSGICRLRSSVRCLGDLVSA